MKKIVFFFIMALSCLMSCSESNLINYNQDAEPRSSACSLPITLWNGTNYLSFSDVCSFTIDHSIDEITNITIERSNNLTQTFEVSYFQIGSSAVSNLKVQMNDGNSITTIHDVSVILYDNENLTIDGQIILRGISLIVDEDDGL